MFPVLNGGSTTMAKEKKGNDGGDKNDVIEPEERAAGTEPEAAGTGDGGGQEPEDGKDS